MKSHRELSWIIGNGVEVLDSNVRNFCHKAVDAIKESSVLFVIGYYYINF